MQVYKSPDGARYFVVDGKVNCKPLTGLALSYSMTVER